MIFDKQRLFSTTPNFTVAENVVQNPNGKTYAIYYDGEPYNGKVTKNFAYIGFPNSEMPDGGYPAVIVCHGGGGCAFYEWVEYWTGKGYACIAPDLSGQKDGSVTLDCNRSPSNPDGGPKGYGPFGMDLKNYKDAWLYHAVCNVIFVNNILRADARVNADKIALTGISWGSVITIITSGVDDRINAFAPVYGGGYIHTTPMFLKEGDPPKDEDLWLKNFDPSAFIPNNKKPMMFTCGLNEPAFAITNNKKSWDLSGGKKIFSWRSDLSHYHRWKDEDNMINVYYFIDGVLNGKDMPFEVVEDKIEDGFIKVKIKGEVDGVRGKLCYSNGDVNEYDNSKIEWTIIEVAQENGEFKARIPSGTTMAVMGLSDGKEIEFALSSKLHFI